jgi:hypothetical protein
MITCHLINTESEQAEAPVVCCYSEENKQAPMRRLLRVRSSYQHLNVVYLRAKGKGHVIKYYAVNSFNFKADDVLVICLPDIDISAIRCSIELMGKLNLYWTEEAEHNLVNLYRDSSSSMTFQVKKNQRVFELSRDCSLESQSSIPSHKLAQCFGSKQLASEMGSLVESILIDEEDEETEAQASDNQRRVPLFLNH